MAIRSNLSAALLVGVVVISLAANGADAESLVRLRIKNGCRIIVPVSVNGHGPYNFLLDTGAAISMVGVNIAQKLGLHAVARVRLGTFTGASTLLLAPVESITVGPESLRDMKVLYCDLPKLFGFDYGIQGVLGQDFLSKFNYLISYHNSTLRFEKDGDLNSELIGPRIPSERNQSKFYLLVQPGDGGETIRRFLLDSGSLDPLVFALPSEMPNLDIVQMVEQKMVAQSSIGRRNVRICRVGTFPIGGLTFKNLRFMVSDLLPGEQRYEDGLLPMSLFDSIYFNNERSCVILNPTYSGNKGSPQSYHTRSQSERTRFPALFIKILPTGCSSPQRGFTI